MREQSSPERLHPLPREQVSIIRSSIDLRYALIFIRTSFFASARTPILLEQRHISSSTLTDSFRR